MKYIDTHCHLDFPDYQKDFPQVLQRMKDNDVGAITIGTDLESSKRAVKIAEENENVWACIGVHPIPAPSPLQGEGWGEVENEFQKLVASPKVVGVGECGLDFYRTKPENFEVEKERQTGMFEKQIQFALKNDLPLMLHCRAAYKECLEILERYKKESGDKLHGNCHFFAGTISEAKRFLDLGFSLSFTGVVTFPPKAPRLPAGRDQPLADTYNVIKSIPIESILSETDAPFVAPAPFRGKRNEPSFVLEVVKRISEIKNVSLEETANQLLSNAIKLFKLD